MVILLDTTIPVHYRFLNLHSAEAGPSADVDAGRLGQANGLCAAAVPGQLSMVTGTHTGPVHVIVELHADEPPLEDEWEEAVEVPFSSGADDLVLTAFQDSTEPLNLPPGNYRMRYCARGMEEAWEADSTDEPIDHYRLQFWPSRDRVLRRTSESMSTTWGGLAEPGLEARVAAVRAAREQRLAGEDREAIWGDDSWTEHASVVGQDEMMSMSIAADDSEESVAAGHALRSAFEALAHASRPDALTAACGALWRHNPDDDVLIRARQAFPQL